jgi:hypothetical protein
MKNKMNWKLLGLIFHTVILAVVLILTFSNLKESVLSSKGNRIYAIYLLIVWFSYSFINNLKILFSMVHLYINQKIA